MYFNMYLYIYTLGIQVCPKISGLYLQSYSGDGIWTINPTIFGRGSWILRDIYKHVSSYPYIYI